MNANYYVNPNVQRQPPPHRRPRSNRTLLLLGGGAAALTILFVMAVFAGLFLLAIMPERIPAGVAIAGVPVGGKTVDEATSALQQLPVQPLTLVDGERTFPITPADLGMTINVDATMDAAEGAQPNADLLPIYQVDLNRAQAGLVSLSEQVNIDAIPDRDGRSMDIPVMLDRLRVDAASEIADGMFDLTMITIPAPTPEEAAASYDGPKSTVIVQQGQELGLIAKEYDVSIADIMALNDIDNPDIIWVGQELIIPAAGVYVPPAPAAPTTVGRSIVVSTENQRIYAYENGTMVRSHLVSTGLPATPTVKGDYKVYVKYLADDMSGPDYFLPQVPYTMYFFQGYAIHGTYWHNAFGRQMSHGCVNLPTEEAQWFFDFASVGTPVRVL
jgi:lipoprotein-anchoring transpeptidase ErfK/SrfK